MKEPKQILESRGERLTNIWIGVGIFNALIFIFLAGDFMEAIKGFLTILCFELGGNQPVDGFVGKD